MTTKQQAFVEAYLANGFNATRAAITAGYSEKTARSIGCENLTKPDIANAIKQAMAGMAMSADEALARLSEHAAGDLGDFLNVDYAELATHSQSRLIKRVKRTVTTRRNSKTQEETETEYFEIELYDAQSALVHILREQHLKAGEATERSDVRVTQAPPLPDDQLDSIFDR